MIRQLKEIIDDPGVDIKLELFGGETPAQAKQRYEKEAAQKPSSTDTELFKALESSAQQEWPSARVASGLFEAGTDASAWRSLIRAATTGSGGSAGAGSTAVENASVESVPTGSDRSSLALMGFGGAAFLAAGGTGLLHRRRRR